MKHARRPEPDLIYSDIKTPDRKIRDAIFLSGVFISGASLRRNDDQSLTL
jgi:hypothetical protein